MRRQSRDAGITGRGKELASTSIEQTLDSNDHKAPSATYRPRPPAHPDSSGAGNRATARLAGGGVELHLRRHRDGECFREPERQHSRWMRPPQRLFADGDSLVLRRDGLEHRARRHRDTPPGRDHARMVVVRAHISPTVHAGAPPARGMARQGHLRQVEPPTVSPAVRGHAPPALERREGERRDARPPGSV